MENNISIDVIPKKHNWFIRFWNYIFQNKLNTFILLTIILTLFTLYLMIYPTYFGTFINYGTDDVAEYHIYIDSLFRKIKTGTLSLYDTGLYGGTSFFSGVYYFAVDFFTVIAFILSYVMPTAVADTLSMLLRIVFGSMIIYAFFARKGFKPVVCLLISFIYFTGGVTQTELVFPVYVGVCFYAPLAMLLVDAVIEKGNRYWLFIPLYGAICIVYDYYISYMLFAFMAVFFVIEMHLYSKKFFLFTKEFYIKLALLLGLIISSVFIATGYALPSIFYMLNESLRSSQAMDSSIWLFGEFGTSTSPWLSHYFCQWINIFMPNDPFSLCLIPAGKYIREHATLYITAGGLLYLSYFFFIWGKTENRLKIWVLLFNIMFCIPLFSMIFTFNGWPYVRWFFIPFLINLYAVAYAMNTKSYNLGTKPFQKLLSLILLALGLGTILMVLITKTDLFMHYDASDYYFYPILVTSAVFITIYIIITFLIIFLEIFRKYKGLRFIYALIPFVILAECIFSGSITFSNIGNEYYVYQSSTILDQKDQIYNYGYKETEGYRINFYTNQGKVISNTNILADKANSNSFFQSFYNANINDYFYDLYKLSKSGWSKSPIYGYGLLNSPITNTKYIIEQKDCQWLHLPDKYYKLLGEYTHEDPMYYNNTSITTRYYENTTIEPFIVYDNLFEYDRTNIDTIKFDMILLKNGYFTAPIEENSKDKFEMIKAESKKKILESGINIKDQDDVKSDIDSYSLVNEMIYTSDGVESTVIPGYIEFDLTSSKYDKLFQHDMIYFVPTSSKYADDDGANFYFYNDESIYNPLHYNMFYPKSYETLEGDSYDYYRPTKFFMIKKTDESYSGRFYAFDFDIIDDYINEQKQYEDKYFSLDKTKMNIKFKNNDTNPKIIKTGYAYSNDWHVKTDGYEAVNIDGGFLGIIVPNNTTDIDVTLEFIPDKLSTGLKVTIVGSIIYLSITIMAFAIPVIKKKRKGLN